MHFTFAEMREVLLVNLNGAITYRLIEVGLVVENAKCCTSMHGRRSGFELLELGVFIELHDVYHITSQHIPEASGDGSTDRRAVPEGVDAVVAAILAPYARRKPVKPTDIFRDNTCQISDLQRLG